MSQYPQKKKLSNSLRYLPMIITIYGFICVTVFHHTTCLIPLDSGFHFSLITVNALFGGFLFTNYSILLSVLDRKTIKLLNATTIIAKRNRHISQGILCASISVIASLIIILFPDLAEGWLYIVQVFVLNVEITYLIFVIIYFLLSMYEMNQLFKTFFPSASKAEEAEMKQYHQQIKSNLSTQEFYEQDKANDL